MGGRTARARRGCRAGAVCRVCGAKGKRPLLPRGNIPNPGLPTKPLDTSAIPAICPAHSMLSDRENVFSGTRASYVALRCEPAPCGGCLARVASGSLPARGGPHEPRRARRPPPPAPPPTSCTAVLALSVMTGAWWAPSGDAIALLGLMAVYLASVECLVLVSSRVAQLASPAHAGAAVESARCRPRT